MNKTIARILTLALALVMCLALAVPAMAIDHADGGDPTVESPVKLNVGTSANVTGDVKFTFTVTSTTDGLPPSVTQKGC